MTTFADAVLPLIRTRADLYRWSLANAHGRDMHEAVDLLEAALPTTDPVEAHRVTERALTSALKVLARADDSSGVIGDACHRLLALHPTTAAAARVPVGKLVQQDDPGLAERGSIIVVIATDLPLAPHQLQKLARRGAIGARLRSVAPETEFARGVQQFGVLLVRVMVAMVLFVLIVNQLLGRPWIDSLLFAAALAVGADHAIDYKAEDFVDAVARITGGNFKADPNGNLVSQLNMTALAYQKGNAQYFSSPSAISAWWIGMKYSPMMCSRDSGSR